MNADTILTDPFFVKQISPNKSCSCLMCKCGRWCNVRQSLKASRSSPPDHARVQNNEQQDLESVCEEAEMVLSCSAASTVSSLLQLAPHGEAPAYVLWYQPVWGKKETSMRVAQQFEGVEMNVNEAQHCWLLDTAYQQLSISKIFHTVITHRHFFDGSLGEWGNVILDHNDRSENFLLLHHLMTVIKKHH